MLSVIDGNSSSRFVLGVIEFPDDDDDVIVAAAAVVVVVVVGDDDV